MSVQIIAEVGSNHCGSLELARMHVDVAAKCKADGVKFQLFRAETLDSRPEKQEKLKKYELPLEWLPELRAQAQAHGLKFGVSVFSPDLVEPCRGYIDFVKISAYDLLYTDLIRVACTLDVPLVLSTAMATYPEIDKVCILLRHWRTGSLPGVTLLHGVAQYPASLEDQNLKVLREMRNLYTGANGLSDHTLGHEAAILAVAMGASMIEKHFVIDPLMNARVVQSPDFPHSTHPTEFAFMVEMIHKTEKALGTGEKTGPLPIEQPLFDTARRSNTKRLRG